MTAYIDSELSSAFIDLLGDKRRHPMTVRLYPCMITTTTLINNTRREKKSHQHNMCQFHHVYKCNLHVILLFPDTHPDTWLGALRE